MGLERLDRRPGCLLGRIEERHVPLKDEVALVGLAIGRRRARDRRARLPVLHGEGEDAEAVGAEALVLLLQLLDMRLIHGETLTVELEARASREDGLGRALGDDPVLAFGSTHHDRHDAPLEVEGDLVDPHERGDVGVLVRLFVREDRAVEDVLESRLEVAVDVGQRENRLVLA